MKRFSSLLEARESELVFRKKPSPLPIEEITDFDVPKAFAKYVVIADEEFNIGNAWWCEDQASGAIYRVSPEFEPLVQLINTSRKAFEATLKAAAKWSAQHDSSAIREAPQLVDELKDTLKKLDPKVFKSKKNHWPMMIDYMKTSAAEGDEDTELWFKLT